MAIYHLTAKVVSRGKGDSSVAAAAYQSRSRLVDERTGELHNYSRRAGELLFEGIYAPKDALDWARDRASLWNHVEAFERRKDAQLARAFDIALPCELTLEQNRYAVQDWVRDNFTRKGWIADVAIHAPGAEGDDRNIHAHVLVVMRKLDGAELAAKKERAATMADRKDELEALRESWERIGNRHLERYGFEPTLDRRSFEDRGIEQLPTVHLGKDVSALERDGVATDRGDLNREIVAENERRVIDLAAERAMRDARTAAQGRTDDTRPEPQQATEHVREWQAHSFTAQPEKDVRLAQTLGTYRTPEPQQAAHQDGSPKLRYRKPADRRSRPQRWRDAVAELVELQGDYQAWLDVLPPFFRGLTTMTSPCLRLSQTPPTPRRPFALLLTRRLTDDYRVITASRSRPYRRTLFWGLPMVVLTETCMDWRGNKGRASFIFVTEPVWPT